MPRRQRVPYEELSKGASIYAPDYGLPARWQERVGCPVCGRSVALIKTHHVPNHRPKSPRQDARDA